MKNILFPLFFVLAISCQTKVSQPVNYGSNQSAGKYIEVNDIKMYYEIYGEGEPLLLLHVNGGSIESFVNQIPVLSKYYKVVAIDSRAQGRTSDSDQEISYTLMASDVSILIDKLKLGKVNILGWSDGGNIGLELALAYPEKVNKLITSGANYSIDEYLAAPDSTPLDPNDSLKMRTSTWVRNFKSTLIRLTPDTSRIPVIRKKLEDLMAKYPTITPEQLQTIQSPVLVIAGDHDLINIDQTVSLFKNLPHSQLYIIPGCSHLGPVEYPDQFNNIVLRFLREPYRDIDNQYFLK